MSMTKGTYRRCIKRLMNRVHKWNVMNGTFYPKHIYDRTNIKWTMVITQVGIVGIRDVYKSIITTSKVK